MTHPAMEIIELTHLFSGEIAWAKYVVLASRHWESFQFKEDLISQVNGDIDLAKVIAFKVGNKFNEWLDYKIPAIENKSPKWCIQNPENINGIKELLLRMP